MTIMTSPLFSYANATDPQIRRNATGLIESICGRSRIEEIYHRWRTEVYGSSNHVFGRMLEMYGIDLALKGNWPLCPIPDGPVLMVSNHPFGVGDGMALGAIAEHFGRPYKVLVNERMMKVPEFRPYILPISFDETRCAVEMNMATRNEAIRLLRDGGTVGIFPAGSVATAPRGFGPAEELPWKMFLPKLVQMGRADVLPIYMEGQNSLLFQLASRISLTARRALLFREFANQSGRAITANVGALMPWSALREIADRKQLMQAIQSAVLAMQPRDERRDLPAALKSKRHHPLWREDATAMGDSLKRMRDRPA